jgi:DNA-binding PadR family transcriptional regulator
VPVKRVTLPAHARARHRSRSAHAVAQAGTPINNDEDQVLLSHYCCSWFNLGNLLAAVVFVRLESPLPRDDGQLKLRLHFARSCDISYDMFYDQIDMRDFWRIAVSRRHGKHGHGFGHFAPGFMGGLGRGGFRTGRKLAAIDLQLLILALLAEKPSHGYELIKALEERSGGFYSPSPGMIYPALTYLEEIGYATVAAEGAKKLYHITDDGRRYLDQNRSIIDAILRELEHIGGKMARVRKVFAGDESSGDDDDAFGSEEIRAARRALKMALRRKHHCSLEEGRRVADILRRAVAEILDR